MASSITRRQALLAATAIAMVPGVASATSRFSVISITNETQRNINFSWRWRSKEWKNDHLAPGEGQAFSYKYDKPNENHSPDFQLSFDSDLTNANYRQEEYLRGYAAPEASFEVGRKYAFRYDGPSKRYIKIKEVR